MIKENMLDKWYNFDFITKLDIVRNINSYDGSFENLEYFENDKEFFDMFFKDGYEVARAIYFGDYNFNDEYVTIDVYGNLESANNYELENMIDDYKEDIIDTIIDDTEDNYCVKQYFEECD